MNKDRNVDLELYAEELSEQLDLSAVPMASFMCASSGSTMSCPGTTASCVGTVSTIG